MTTENDDGGGGGGDDDDGTDDGGGDNDGKAGTWARLGCTCRVTSTSRQSARCSMTSPSHLLRRGLAQTLRPILRPHQLLQMQVAAAAPAGLLQQQLPPPKTTTPAATTTTTMCQRGKHLGRRPLRVVAVVRVRVMRLRVVVAWICRPQQHQRRRLRGRSRLHRRRLLRGRKGRATAASARAPGTTPVLPPADRFPLTEPFSCPRLRRRLLPQTPLRRWIRTAFARRTCWAHACMRACVLGRADECARRLCPIRASLCICGAFAAVKWVRGRCRCRCRCGAMRCDAVRCGAVWCGAVRCGAVRCVVVRA
jgi:hypothetical protein